MKNFSVLSIAGLLVGSMSAQAGVITIPESISFDINADPETFSIPFTGDLKEGFTNGIDVPSVYYTLENDTFYAFIDGAGYHDGIIDAGLQLFTGRHSPSEAELRGKEPIIGPLLGQIYTYTVRFNFYELLPCEGPGGFCSTGAGGSVYESVQVSFYDGSAQEVPVGPTAPLLAAGLAGLYLRRRKN